MLESTDRSQAALESIAAEFSPKERVAVGRMLVGRFQKMSGSTADSEIGCLLEAIRSLGPDSEISYAPLCESLAPQSRLYSGRSKLEAVRIRAFLLVTIAALGRFADSLGGAVDHLNNGMTPLEVASGAYAARRLPEFAEVLVPVLRRRISGTGHDAMLSLLRYEQDFPLAEATTIQLEAIRTIRSFGPLASAARPELTDLAARLKGGVGGQPLPILEEALSALSAVDISDAAVLSGRPSPCCLRDNATFVSEWLEPAARRPLRGRTQCTDQSGRTLTLHARIDRPTFLMFFYTRCENPLKCSRSAGLIGQLQRSLERRKLEDRVRLLMMTLEPTFDSPELLRDFAVARGVSFDNETAQVLVPDPPMFSDLLDELAVPVGYDGPSVTAHDVGLYLFDGQARCVRRYSHAIWDLDRLMEDLEKLLDERVQ